MALARLTARRMNIQLQRKASLPLLHAQAPSSAIAIARAFSSPPRTEADSKLKRPRMEEIVLVRHGESEGNLAFNRSVAGDHSLYADEFLERHSSFWRLTDQGREQALITGEWMRDNIDTRFDSFFSSEYLRAMETAALLDLPGAKWKPEVMLRERDWGEYDLASQLERRVAFRRYEGRRRRESLFWAPPGGESLAQVVQRVDSVLLFGNRRFSGGRVIMTCHGELMWAFRLRFERLTQLKYREMQADPQVLLTPALPRPPTISPVSNLLLPALSASITSAGPRADPQLPSAPVHAPLPRDQGAPPRLPVHALRLPMGPNAQLLRLEAHPSLRWAHERRGA